MTYTIIEQPMYGTVIRRDEDNAFIPIDEANTDYQRYLEWLSAGNVPQPWEG